MYDCYLLNHHVSELTVRMIGEVVPQWVLIDAGQKPQAIQNSVTYSM